MKLRIKFVFLTSLLFAIVINAQNPNPGEDAVYLEREVTEIRIVMSVKDNELIHAEENRLEEIYVPSEISISNSMLDNVIATGAGVRLRGNSSRSHDKRPYKIDFKEFEGSKFEGYKKFNLKPNVNDPSIIRELLAMHMYRLMDVPSIRVTLATVYINNAFKGIYLNTEQIDDEFVDSRFGHEDGFLYKCSQGANLQDDDQVFSNDIYESKINKDEDTRAELNNFVKILNNTSSSSFKTEIEKVFNVDNYLRQMAVEAVLGHWDGYSYNTNNFYLFYDAQTELIEFIPYDADNTWGIDFYGNRDWGTRNLLSFYRGDKPRPLSTRILEVQEYKELYVDYLKKMYEDYFTKDYLEPLFDHYENLLKPFIEVDDDYKLAFDFTNEDFSSSFDYGTKKHVKYGLRGFLETRRSTGWDLILKVVGAKNWDVMIYPNPSNDPRFSFVSFGVPFVRIYNIYGKSAPHKIDQIGANKYEVSLTSVGANGLYIIDVNGTKTKWYLNK